MEAGRANFVDFIADASRKPDMERECIETMQKVSADELSEWFKGKGYDVSVEECKKLIDDKYSIKQTADVDIY